MVNARKTSKKTAAKVVVKKRAARKSGSATPRRKSPRPRVDGPVASRCAHGGRLASSGPTGTRGPVGATGPLGPSSTDEERAKMKSDGRRVEFPLPSGRRVAFTMTRVQVPGRIGVDLELTLSDAAGASIASTSGSMITREGRGPVVEMRTDASRLEDFPPADVLALFEEAVRSMPFPEEVRAQVLAQVETVVKSYAAGQGKEDKGAGAKMIKNGATLLREPEGGARVLLHRATIAFDDGGGVKPGWLVLVKHRAGGADVGTSFVADEARSICRGAGDVYEFALDGVSWIVGVPKGGA